MSRLQSFHQPKERPLPPGFWIYFSGLPSEATNESVSEWLRSQGLEIPPERVDCNPRRDGTLSAVVSLSDSTLFALVKWALTDPEDAKSKMNGHVVAIEKRDCRA
jgi:hypothetical protein